MSYLSRMYTVGLLLRDAQLTFPSTTPRQNAGGKYRYQAGVWHAASAFNDTPAERRGKDRGGASAPHRCRGPSTTPRQNAGGKVRDNGDAVVSLVPSTTPRQNAGGKGKSVRSSLWLFSPSTTPRQNAGGKPTGRGCASPRPQAFNDTPAERRGKGTLMRLDDGQSKILQRHPGRTPGERARRKERTHLVAKTFNDTPAERRGKGRARRAPGVFRDPPSTTPRQNAGGKIDPAAPITPTDMPFNDTPAERRGKGGSFLPSNSRM